MQIPPTADDVELPGRNRQIKASTAGPILAGLVCGRREGSASPAIPSAMNRRQVSSDCLVVPKRSATSMIGEPPNTSHTARYRYSTTAC